MVLESKPQPIQKESSDANMNDSQSVDELDKQSSVDKVIGDGSGAADFLLDDDWKAGHPPRQQKR
jgi:hypothetical protein